MFTSRKSLVSGLLSAAAVVAVAGVSSLAFTAPANASMLVSAVLGYGGTNMIVPVSGTVAAAPSTGSNEWNGFGANGNQPYDITFNPVDSNGNVTGITGTFVETNSSYQKPWYVTPTNGNYYPSGGILPPFVNIPGGSWNGYSPTDLSSPSNPTGPDTLTLTGLSPSGSYDVYVYSAYVEGVLTGGNTPTVSLTLTQGTAATTSYKYTYNMNDSNLLASYQLGTNYEEFQNVTPDSTGTIAIAGTAVNSALFNAFQLYTVPEPATIGLVAVGGIGLLLMARRRKIGA